MYMYIVFHHSQAVPEAGADSLAAVPHRSAAHDSGRVLAGGGPPAPLPPRPLRGGGAGRGHREATAGKAGRVHCT